MSANSNTVKEPSSIPSRIISVLLVAALLALAGAIFSNLQDQTTDARYRAVVGDLRISIQQVFAEARFAVNGDEPAFGSLGSAKNTFQRSMSLLQKGDSDVEAITNWLPKEYVSLNQSWSKVSVSIETILANQERILFLHEVADTLNESIPELQQEYNLVVDVMVDSGSRSDQVVLAQRQALLGERIARNIEKMLAGDTDAANAADQFNLDASLFGSVLRGMIDGNAAMRIDKVVDEEALESLTEIDELYSFVNNSVDKIFQASPDLSSTRQALDLILTLSTDLSSDIDALLAGIDSISGQRLIKQEYIYGLAAAVLFLVVALALIAGTNARRRLDVEEQTNESSQRAILTLLDELADLADGDLRTKATVTEEFTGAIADSINFTIDQLRVLVSRITNSSASISSAAEQAKSTSEELSRSADEQAKKITDATLAINEMADTIDTMSSSAAESAEVANQSVQIAKNGGNVVRNTIGGMDTIREQIQDTSKRIKRLGESSQEIGDIVSLINDIADQTNILSLNAAIQASMAGDAGRGFAVVADEVQRLAERSSGATKQIEALVKAIQTDTNEAVVSMEQTTTEVVRGAQLAQNAGVALEDIETASSNIAQLIRSISVSASEQAQKAVDVSDTMNIIQDITSQTSAGTAATADSIGELTNLSDAMRSSVSGFSLPDTEESGEEEASTIDTLEQNVVELTESSENENLAEDEQSQPSRIPLFDTVSDLGAFVDAPEIDPVVAEDETVDVQGKIIEQSIGETETEVEVEVEVESSTDESRLNAELNHDSEESIDTWAETVQFDSIETVQMDNLGDIPMLEPDVSSDKLSLHKPDITGAIVGREQVVGSNDDVALDLETLLESVSDADVELMSESMNEAVESDEDEFMLGLDDDFDLDLDDFSFDDEPPKNS